MNHQKIIEKIIGKIKSVDKMVDQMNGLEEGYEAIGKALEKIASYVENGLLFLGLAFGIPATLHVILDVYKSLK